MSPDEAMAELTELTEEMGLYPHQQAQVRAPFVTFVVACPSCRAEVPLPVVVVTPVLEMRMDGKWIGARLTEMPTVEHECVTP